MISKSLIIWHGQKESEASSGAFVHFSTHLLERERAVYLLKNQAGEIVARLELLDGCRWRELATTEGSSS